jgi:hypothetical protein
MIRFERDRPRNVIGEKSPLMRVTALSNAGQMNMSLPFAALRVESPGRQKAKHDKDRHVRLSRVPSSRSHFVFSGCQT